MAMRLTNWRVPVLLGLVNDAHPALKNFSHNLVAKFVLYGEQSHAPILTIRAAMSKASELPFSVMKIT